MRAGSPVVHHHPGGKISRNCIIDTYVAKRTNVFKQGGLAAKLSAYTLRQLRGTQFAPHIKTKLIKALSRDSLDNVLHVLLS